MPTLTILVMVIMVMPERRLLRKTGETLVGYPRLRS